MTPDRRRRPQHLAELAFAQAPLGLAVLGPGGRIEMCNDRMRALVPGADVGATCCELFGCKKRDPLRAGCLYELATAADDALPDCRVDLRVDGEQRSANLVAGRLDERHVLIQTRPAAANDRRRRTEPHWTAPPTLRIAMLGAMTVRSTEGELTGPWLEQRPGQLLKYLAHHRWRLVNTDEIAHVFWPLGGRAALGSVRHAVFHLRRHLRTSQHFVITASGGYRLDPQAVSVDVDDFEALARRGSQAFRTGDLAAARGLLAQAAQLYRGVLLADDPYCEWAFAERERLHDVARHSLFELSEIASQTGETEARVDYLRRLSELEPFDAEIQRELIRVLVGCGRLGEASRRYRALEVSWSKRFSTPVPFALEGISGNFAA